MSRVQEVPGLCFSALFAFIPEPLETGWSLNLGCPRLEAKLRVLLSPYLSKVESLPSLNPRPLNPKPYNFA